MDKTRNASAVWFTTNGRVVILLRLRQQFHIKDGTKAIVETTSDGILPKPVTRWAIERACGMLKPKPGDKSLAEQWAEHKREERELENANHCQRLGI